MLLNDRDEGRTDISYFATAAAEAGVVVCRTGTGVGANLDQGTNVAGVVATPGASDRPLGILLNDVVSTNLAKGHINWYKDEVPVGSKVTILRQGWVLTDQIVGTPAAGDTAYCAPAGGIATSGDAALVIGEFTSTKDTAGFARVEVNLPNN
jgi:hypothetical protein